MEILLQGAVSVALIIITWAVAANKNNKEILKLRAEIDKINSERGLIEIETSKKLVEFFKNETNELLERVNHLNVKIVELTETIDKLKIDISEKSNTLRWYEELLNWIEFCDVSKTDCTVKKRIRSLKSNDSTSNQ